MLLMPQVWMRRHCFSDQADGLSGFLVSMLTAHLVQQSRLVGFAQFACLFMMSLIVQGHSFDLLARCS